MRWPGRLALLIGDAVARFFGDQNLELVVRTRFAKGSLGRGKRKLCAAQRAVRIEFTVQDQ